MDETGGTPPIGQLLGDRQNRPLARTASYAEGSGSSTLTFEYEVTSADGRVRAVEVVAAEVEEYFGHFLSHRVRPPLAQPIGNQRTAEVIRTEEQGSDVNLAVHLLDDGWLDAYDCAVVVSNDSDIAEAMRLVRQHHAKRIGLVTPGTGRPCRQLMAHADFARG